MCFTVQRKNPLFGKPKSVCMHRRVKQWVLWGGHWWPSSAQALPVCVYLCNICVWSDGHPEVVTCAYFTQPHLCVWKYVYVWMTGAQRWPSMSTSSVSPASKQVRLRQSRRKNRKNWTKDITAAGDVNEKWHCGSISVSSVRRHMKRKQCLNLLWRMQLENMWSNSLNLCASNALNGNLHPTSIFMYSYCLSKHYNSVEIYYCATNRLCLPQLSNTGGIYEDNWNAFHSN